MQGKISINIGRNMFEYDMWCYFIKSWYEIKIVCDKTKQKYTYAIVICTNNIRNAFALPISIKYVVFVFGEKIT